MILFLVTYSNISFNPINIICRPWHNELAGVMLMPLPQLPPSLSSRTHLDWIHDTHTETLRHLYTPINNIYIPVELRRRREDSTSTKHSISVRCINL